MNYSTEKTRHVLLGDHIIKVIVNGDANLDVSDLEKIRDLNNKIMDGKKYAVLVDAGDFAMISPEAREAIAKPEFSENALGKAILVRNIGQRLVGNVYLNFNKPAMQTRLFKNEAEAMKWLTQLVADSEK